MRADVVFYILGSIAALLIIYYLTGLIMADAGNDDSKKQQVPIGAEVVLVPAGAGWGWSDYWGPGWRDGWRRYGWWRNRPWVGPRPGEPWRPWGPRRWRR